MENTQIDHEHILEWMDQDEYGVVGEYLTSIGVSRSEVREKLKNDDGYKYNEGALQDIEKYTRINPDDALGRKIKSEYKKESYWDNKFNKS